MPKFKIKHKKLLPPITKNKETLQIQFSISVPSTILERQVKSNIFNQRAKEVATFLSNTFGGDTTIKGKGDYTKDGKLINDEVFIVESSATRNDYLKNRTKLSEKLTSWRERWKQMQIFYNFEDKAYLYPNFKTVAKEEKQGKFAEWRSKTEEILKTKKGELKRF